MLLTIMLDTGQELTPRASANCAWLSPSLAKFHHLAHWSTCSYTVEPWQEPGTSPPHTGKTICWTNPISPLSSSTTPCGEKLNMQLLLDPSACPMVIAAAQTLGDGVVSHLLYMTRTWCHAHHLKRKRLLRLYNII